MKTTKTKAQPVNNTYVTLTPSINACIKFWAKRSLRGDIQEVRTTFNTELYLAYLKALK